MVGYHTASADLPCVACHHTILEDLSYVVGCHTASASLPCAQIYHTPSAGLPCLDYGHTTSAGLMYEIGWHTALTGLPCASEHFVHSSYSATVVSIAQLLDYLHLKVSMLKEIHLQPLSKLHHPQSIFDVHPFLLHLIVARYNDDPLGYPIALLESSLTHVTGILTCYQSLGDWYTHQLPVAKGLADCQ
eukprot:Gb_18276 [translate_table: standard]